MRKITAFLVVMTALTPTLASAETIYTSSPVEYSAKLAELSREASPDIPSIFRISSEQASASARTLLVYYVGDPDTQGAKHDIIDEDNIHTLIYNTEEDANAAYDYYIENGIPVCHDEVLQVESYLSWGSKTIGTDAFVSGLQKTYQNNKMPNVTVAVLDTGVDYTHSFLKNRVDTAKGWDFYNNDNDPMDDNNHGTHVAGIVADNTLPNVTIIPIKVAGDSGGMTTTQVKSGLQRAYEIGADVINMSLGASAEDYRRSMRSVFNPIFNNLHQSGCVICVAAGNAYKGLTNNADYIFPAYMDHTITVANCTQNGSISKSSNYGSVIDISAPGTSIYSTIRNNDYANMSGTSMASPFAAAAAALLKTRDPYITPDEIESELRANATQYSAEFEDDYFGLYGAGILNISNYYYDPADAPARTEAPTRAPSPTPTVIPGHEQLISNVEYDNNGVITAIVENKGGLLKDGAVIMAVGYKDGRTEKMQVMEVKSDGDVSFREHLPYADKYDKIKLFVWRSYETAQPLSLPYSVQVLESNGEYVVKVLEE